MILWTTVVLFAIAAAGGLVMAAVSTFTDSHPPAWVLRVGWLRQD